MRQVQVRQIDDCWEWTGALGSDGYGIFREHGHNYRAHVASLLLWGGVESLPWPTEPAIGAPMVLHRCDRPWCVNPDHLYAGDAKQNARDCRDRGRMPIGRTARENRIRSNPASVKLTETMVEEIRLRVGRGELQKDLAEEFRISRAQISRVVTGKRWMP
jgi:hypothetical protein